MRAILPIIALCFVWVSPCSARSWQYLTLTIDERSGDVAVVTSNDGATIQQIEAAPTLPANAQPAIRREPGKRPTLTNILNDIGSAGWELVATRQIERRVDQLIFKRIPTVP